MVRLIGEAALPVLGSRSSERENRARALRRRQRVPPDWMPDRAPARHVGSGSVGDREIAIRAQRGPVAVILRWVFADRFAAELETKMEGDVSFTSDSGSEPHECG